MIESNISPHWIIINGTAVDFEVRLDKGSDSSRVDLYMADVNSAREMGWIELQASRRVSTFVEALNVIVDWNQQLEEEVGVYDFL